ncbi:MAG: flagellar export chaperone FliS [Chitinophagaceae bacterium]|nr:flagellar export chaperone FliS [Oligoflexus sp.]
MTNPYKTYQKTQVTTASREKILLMLYEGAIRFVKHAQVAMQEKKIADKGRNLSKATAILSELMATLDFKSGGQLAIDLESLYIFMIDKLIEGNINNDMECLKNVESILRTLHAGWQDVIENPRPDGVPSPKLQPEEYAKWLANNPGEAEKFSQNKAKAAV